MDYNKVSEICRTTKCEDCEFQDWNVQACKFQMYYPRNWHLIATVKAPLTLDERSRLNALKVMFGEKYNRVSRDVHGVIWLEGLPGHMLQLGANSFPTLENGKMIDLDGAYISLGREVGQS